MGQYKGLVVVLNDESKFQPLLKTYVANDIHGCTVFDSKGMTHLVVDQDDDMDHFKSLRTLLKPQREGSKTLLIVGNELDIEKTVKITLEVIGDINKPDSGFMMTFPIDNVYGFSKK